MLEYEDVGGPLSSPNGWGLTPGATFPPVSNLSGGFDRPVSFLAFK